MDLPVFILPQILQPGEVDPIAIVERIESALEHPVISPKLLQTHSGNVVDPMTYTVPRIYAIELGQYVSGL